MICKEELHRFRDLQEPPEKINKKRAVAMKVFRTDDDRVQKEVTRRSSRKIPPGHIVTFLGRDGVLAHSMISLGKGKLAGTQSEKYISEEMLDALTSGDPGRDLSGFVILDLDKLTWTGDHIQSQTGEVSLRHMAPQDIRPIRGRVLR